VRWGLLGGGIFLIASIGPKKERASHNPPLLPCELPYIRRTTFSTPCGFPLVRGVTHLGDLDFFSFL